VVLLAAAIGSAAAPAWAQGTAAITGVVRDSTGSLVPGATVAATNAVTGAERTTVTDAEGRYRLAALPGGRYQVSAVLAGFRTEVRTIDLTGAEMALDFALGVEIQEQIVVTALRRAERLQDVPASIDAFDAGMIEQAGITSMRDYLGMAPQIS
jgi:hypothetical protein